MLMNHETSGQALHCVMSSMLHLLKEGTDRVSSTRGMWVEVNFIAISNYRAGPMCYVPPWVWTSVSCNEPGWVGAQHLTGLCPHCQRTGVGWAVATASGIEGAPASTPRQLVLLPGPELMSLLSCSLSQRCMPTALTLTGAWKAVHTHSLWLGGIFGVVKYLSKVK